MKSKYKAKPIFYILVTSIVLALFIPILLPVVLGFWVLLALINFANTIMKENRS